MAKLSEDDVIKIIKDSFVEKNIELTVNSSATDVENWDSLAQINIILALDKVFDGKIAGLSEMATANSVTKILTLLKENGLV